MNNFKNINFYYDNKESENPEIFENENKDNIINKTRNVEIIHKKYIIYIIIGISFLILSSLFILLGIVIQRKCLNYRRKKRVNELEDVINENDTYNKVLV